MYHKFITFRRGCDVDSFARTTDSIIKLRDAELIWYAGIWSRWKYIDFVLD